MSVQVIRLITSQMSTNTYVVVNGDLAFVVDPGDEAQLIVKTLNSVGAKLDAILLTHAHFDHIGAVAELLRIAPQCENKRACVFLHKDDVDKISSYKNMGFAVGAKVEPFVPDILLNGGETITVAGVKVDVIHTSGHTKGGVCYKLEDILFTGDTMFLNSYGRTDFYDGSFAEIKNSIMNKLFRLQGDFTVLSGHGEPSTLEYERKHNPVIWQNGDFDIVD